MGTDHKKEPLATTAQINYFAHLGVYDRSKRLTPETTRKEASEIIKYLLEKRKQVQESSESSDSPDSRQDWNEAMGGM